jgi:hypothetical protein
MSVIGRLLDLPTGLAITKAPSLTRLTMHKNFRRNLSHRALGMIVEDRVSVWSAVPNISFKADGFAAA